MIGAPEPLRATRAALSGQEGWLVGGAVRDRLLGRPVLDLDLVVPGEARAPARRLAGAVGGPAFALSDAWGAWRVLAPDRSWQADLTPLRGQRIEDDLALRDFTVNAIAEPLGGGPPVDPFGGREDLAARRLRMVAERAFADDPLRVVRLARLARELDLAPDRSTAVAAREHAAGLRDVSPERVFGELRRILLAPEPHRGVELLRELRALAVVLPELEALRGLEQTVYHHADAYGHTLEVLERAAALEQEPGAVVGDEHAGAVAALLAEPLADELTRGGALRLGALLHDIAKPHTQTPAPKGGFGFPGHDALGADQARAILTRLRTSERLRAHVAGLARHHLRLGFLVHQAPLDRRMLHRYLRACGPIAPDVTLLSVADRLATRGRKHETATAAHLAVAAQVLPAALDWHREGPPAPLVRGDELARALGLAPGPELGRLLEALAEAQYAGEIASVEEAVAYARELSA